MRITEARSNELLGEALNRFAAGYFLPQPEAISSGISAGSLVRGMETALSLANISLRTATGAENARELSVIQAELLFARSEAGKLLCFPWPPDPQSESPASVLHITIIDEFVAQAGYTAQWEFTVDKDLPPLKSIGGIAVNGPTRSAFFGHPHAVLPAEHAEALQDLTQRTPGIGYYVAEPNTFAMEFASPTT